MGLKSLISPKKKVQICPHTSILDSSLASHSLDVGLVLSLRGLGMNSTLL